MYAIDERREKKHVAQAAIDAGNEHTANRSRAQTRSVDGRTIIRAIERPSTNRALAAQTLSAARMYNSASRSRRRWELTPSPGNAGLELHQDLSISGLRGSK